MAVLGRSERDLARVAAEIERDSGIAMALTADVTEPSAGEMAVAETERRLGPLDLLVNAAGMLVREVRGVSTEMA